MVYYVIMSSHGIVYYIGNNGRADIGGVGGAGGGRGAEGAGRAGGARGGGAGIEKKEAILGAEVVVGVLFLQGES